MKLSDDEHIDRCWCCGTIGIEHDPYLEVVAMDADKARALVVPDVMPAAFKVEYQGQADPARYKFGARVYRVFASREAWEHYQKGLAS